jgi:hypothetical protein
MCFGKKQVALDARKDANPVDSQSLSFTLARETPFVETDVIRTEKTDKSVAHRNVPVSELCRLHFPSVCKRSQPGAIVRVAFQGSSLVVFFSHR